MATGQKLLRKITIKEVIGGKPEILAAAMTGREGKSSKGDPVALLRVVGQVLGYKTGESDFGSFVELRGSFAAVNLLTGETTDNCTRAILPDVVGDALAMALRNGAEAAEFAVEIDVAFDEAAATMYVYSVRTLLKTAPAAPVLGILAKLEASGIAMTAPRLAAPPKLSPEDAAAQRAAEATADAQRSAKEKTKDKAPAKA